MEQFQIVLDAVAGAFDLGAHALDDPTQPLLFVSLHPPGVLAHRSDLLKRLNLLSHFIRGPETGSFLTPGPSIPPGLHG